MAPAALAALLLAIPGCGGCASQPKEIEPEKAAEARTKAEAERREREKPPFEVENLWIQPNSLAIEQSVKPGHWTSATLTALANRDDFSGLLAVEPLDLPQAPFRLGTTRPLVLSKGQRKTAETLFFLPVGFSRQQVATQLTTNRGGELTKTGHRLRVIPEQQYFFVVLAGEPDRYRYLRDLDSVRAPSNPFDTMSSDAHYRVVIPHVKSRAPLATNPLGWTNTAYLLWDTFDPSKLTLAQQQALVDWLHWGGQLIISGPESLDGLSGSFLAPYLPARSAGSLALDAELLAPLAAERVACGGELSVGRPWPGEQLVPRDGAEVTMATPSGDPLIVERRAGAGRVLATAFRLGQGEFKEWDGCDACWNQYILRRPGRSFLVREGEVAVAWSNGAGLSESRYNTRLRFFSRDAELHAPAPSRRAADPLTEADDEFERWQIANQGDQRPAARSTAGWNDGGAVAQIAQRTVRDATRIEIPDASFVVRMLALYLLVLVPVNWLVFRAIGRVEWAWAAAPVIALIGAVVVVRAAQLDIGFVRATHELATIEIFADHPRAHLTRFTTLYSSLTTNYDLRFAEPTALAQPFPSGAEQLLGQGRSNVVLDRAEEVVLRHYPVISNSVGIVHSEQMFDLQGTLSLLPDPDRPGRWRLHNGTRLTLRDAGLLQPDGAAWLGTVEPGETVAVEFNLPLGGAAWEDHRRQSPQTAPEATEGVTHLQALVHFAESERARGEWRLAAWTDEPLGGLTIEPRAAQARQAAVIVAHLRPGELPAPERDQSSRAEQQLAAKQRRSLVEEEPLPILPPTP